MSPVLFCIYMDTLLARLENSGYGCYIGHTFSGAVSYADDIALIAPTHRSTQELLDICETFAEEYSVLFNSTKSNLIIFNNQRRSRHLPPDLYLHGSPIPCVERAVHLGDFVGKEANKFNIKKACQDLNGKVNVLICNYSFCHVDTLCYLFKAFCTSFYGSPLWDLHSNSLDEFLVCWRKAVRRLLGVNYRTRSKLLPHILDSLDVKIDLFSRFSSFYFQLLRSKNNVVYVSVAHRQFSE